MIVDKAIRLRDAGQLSAAENLLRPLTAGSNSIGASYILGTIELSRGGTEANDGLRRLLQTEVALRAASRDCARGLGWYSIYNTLGAQYYRRGQFDSSEEYLLRGYSHLDDMFDSTKRLLLSNLGLLYFSKGNLDKSLGFYEQAARAGSQDAAKRIDAIQRIRHSK